MTDTRSALKTLFHPESIAVIGASTNPRKISGKSFHLIKEHGYSGRLYAVNPRSPEVQGVATHKSIGEVPEAVDLVFIAVPATLVIESVEACVQAKAKSVVIFSSGFAEMDEAGAAQQEILSGIARRSGIRIVGPNCMGVMNIGREIYGTFTSAFDHGFPKLGRLGIVSQSGAFGAHCMVLAREQGLGLNLWATTGNECDVDFADCLSYLAEDDSTDVILAYMEGARDKHRLMAALEKARAAGKPVVMLKVGRTELGAAAAYSHTASLAGSDQTYDALFKQFGVYRAETIHDLMDVAYACTAGNYPKSRRVGLVTISGGVGVLMADAAQKVGLEVPLLPEATQAKMKKLIPYAATRNPVDTTAMVLDDVMLVRRNLEIMLEEGGCDSVVLFLSSVGLNKILMGRLTDALLELRKTHPRGVIAITTLVRPELKERLEAEGFLILEDPAWGVGVIAALCQYAEAFAGPPVYPPAALPAGLPRIPPHRLGELAANRLLAEAGLPMVPLRLASSAEEAVSIGGAMTLPVVLKIASPDITHKTEMGGVLLNVNTLEAIRQGYAELLRRAKAHHPQASIDGVLMAPQVNDGIEFIAGVARDPVFGPVVMCGLGGVFVEVMKDVSFRIAPFGEAEAQGMLEELKGYPLLTGIRGAPPSDVEALAALLARLSQFSAANEERLESLDMNPVRVFPQGKGVLGLDAVIIPKD